MKKLFTLAAAGFLAISVFLVGSPVSAQQATCDIGFIGPNSNNMCISTTEYACEVTNTNTVTIRGENEQDGVSGEVAISGGSGGDATSGTITNSNGTVFNVTITSAESSGSEGDNCVAVVTVQAKPSPEVKPEPEVKPISEGDVKVLPVTSGSSYLEVAGLVAGSLAVVAALAATGSVLYKRYKS